MNEIKEILRAFDTATLHGKRCTLATVVQVDGSSYRRPGARMLITDEGQSTGAISGGCLEGDALLKAKYAISTGENKLVTYDSTSEDDIEVGLHLGCNGIVRILFEPINILDRDNPIEFLRKVSASDRDAVLVTLFSLKNRIHPGTSLLYLNSTIHNRQTQELNVLLAEEIKHSFLESQSRFKHIEIENQLLTAFVEFIPPPISLVIAGAGNDVQPLVEMASLLGWSCNVVDGRYHHAVKWRFPRADRVLYCRPGYVLNQISTNAQTVFLLMTHNYNYDLALLKELAEIEFSYIGLLGPSQKRNRLLADLTDAGIHFSESQMSKIHGPVGLDIGAENGAEIALSILSEIKAFLSGAAGGSLRLKQEAIHGRDVHMQHHG
jgi:xanthine dehydrogenase accessory factor